MTRSDVQAFGPQWQVPRVSRDVKEKVAAGVSLEDTLQTFDGGWLTQKCLFHSGDSPP